MVNKMSKTSGKNMSRRMPWKHAPAVLQIEKKPLVRCQKILMIRFELRTSSGVHRPARAESP